MKTHVSLDCNLLHLQLYGHCLLIECVTSSSKWPVVAFNVPQWQPFRRGRHSHPLSNVYAAYLPTEAAEQERVSDSQERMDRALSTAPGAIDPRRMHRAIAALKIEEKRLQRLSHGALKDTRMPKLSTGCLFSCLSVSGSVCPFVCQFG